jgi:hypothetical protein
MKLGNTMADTFSGTSSLCIAYSISRLPVSLCIKLYSVGASKIITLSILRHYNREHNTFTNTDVTRTDHIIAFRFLLFVIILQALKYTVRYGIKSRPNVLMFFITVVLLVTEEENSTVEYNITGILVYEIL